MRRRSTTDFQVALVDVAGDFVAPTTLIGEKLYKLLLKYGCGGTVKASDRHFKVDYASPPTEQDTQVMQTARLHRQNPGMARHTAGRPVL